MTDMAQGAVEWVDNTAPSEMYEQRLLEARAALTEAARALETAQRRLEAARRLGGLREVDALAEWGRADAVMRAARQRAENGEHGRWRVRRRPGGGFEIDEG